ncbi:unnamed protein product [Trichogramma brassicae]|uniref:G-protein coupled receptors family 2 profile 2 domain-containing protein n=1 Tax=Trichogramma brassicae TaxID=86971 RepID=A0A6H5I436_9HYME|nr:unnamed protein product [Trichogramma brassicae]
MYYAYMCAFFWLNIISFNIWKSVWYPSCSPDRKFMFLVYSLVGWLTPLAFLLVAVACHHGLEIVHPFNPGMGEIGCWFAATLQLIQCSRTACGYKIVFATHIYSREEGASRSTRNSMRAQQLYSIKK